MEQSVIPLSKWELKCNFKNLVRWRADSVVLSLDSRYLGVLSVFTKQRETFRSDTFLANSCKS